MKTTKRRIAILATTAMMLLATLLTAAPSAEARTTDQGTSDTIVVRTTNGGDTKPSCPKGALGVPGACYVFVSKDLVLTFDDVWMYVCPSGSIEDNNSQCRKPVADAG